MSCFTERCICWIKKKKKHNVGIPWWSSDWDSELPMQGAWVRSLVRELDPSCHSWRCYMSQRRLMILCTTPKTLYRQINKYLKEKKKHNMRAELSFIWGKMRTIAWETAFQIALRNCSKEVGGRSVYLWFWWRGSSCSQAHIFCRRFLLVTRNRCHHGGF